VNDFSGDVQTHSFTIPAPEDKDDRRKIHFTIRNNLRDFESSQEPDPISGDNVIKAQHSGAKNKKKRVGYTGESDYTKFTVHKEFIDTPSAIHIISKKLWRNAKDFTVAGNKDKRGVTTQKVVAKRVLPYDLKRITFMKKWPETLKICDIEWCDSALKIGDLYGNQFTVALRFIEPQINDIQQSRIN